MATTSARAVVRQPAAAVPAAAAFGVTLPPRAQSYYQRIESYAMRIRASRNVEEIVGLLDAALRETQALAEQEELRIARDRIAEAESQIQMLKAELSHAESLVQIDQLTGALNRRGLESAFTREAARSDRQIGRAHV